MTQNHIGYSVYVATAVPTTNDSTGFEALTWVKVNGLVQGPQLGYEHDQIAIPDLTTGFEDSVKGMGRGTDTQMQFRTVASDTGQGNVRTQATDDDGTASVKLVRGTGTDNAPAEGDYVEYAQGYLHSFLPNQPTGSSYEGFTVSFRSTNKPVVATEPAA